MLRPYLTQHFTPEEFVASERALRMGIRNEPTALQWNRIVVLCEEILEPWRALMGGKPLQVNDGGGFRSEALNAAIPGASRSSQHMRGEAADVTPGIPMKQAFEILKASGLPVHQAIFERNARGGCWIHVSIAPEGQAPAGRFLMHSPELRGYPEWDGRDLCARS